MFEFNDVDLHGLDKMSTAAMARIANVADVRILRLRYRRRARAIVHVALDKQPDEDNAQGVFWFFRGDKGKRIARRNKSCRFDSLTGAVFERFPDDHRMPVISAFLRDHRKVLTDLIGNPGTDDPLVVRYRPGLACTFRCVRADGTRTFVKLVNDEDVERLRQINEQIACALVGSQVFVPQCIGHESDYSAIAFEEASGESFEDLLGKETSPGKAEETTQRVLQAMAAFWNAPIKPNRLLDRDALLSRANAAREMITYTMPMHRNLAALVVSQLAASDTHMQQRPIHGDLKLEHVFLSPDQVTLIDTDSLSIGDPDYDRAQLHARLQVAQLLGAVTPEISDVASNMIAAGAGANFHWCRRVAALRVAKFFAQRPGPESTRLAGQLLESFA